MEWRDIPQYRGLYKVSEDGQVVRVGRNILKQKIDRYGYANVCLCSFNKPRSFRVHVLVTVAFHGERPLGKYAAHWDGNRLNNSKGNLRWATGSENAADKTRHGRDALGERNGKYTHPEKVLSGEKHPSAKLTANDVRKIKRLLRKGVLQRDLAIQFKVTRPTITGINNNKTWSSVCI